MAMYLADTMAVVRYFAGERLGQQAAQLFREADEGQHIIFISAITLMEILYLSEGRRVKLGPAALLTRIADSSNYAVLPMDEQVVLAAVGLGDVGELHDRMIAATAKHHKLPLITNDPILAQSKHITTLW